MQTSIVLDVKYIRLLSTKVVNFKDLGRGLFRCKCPLCGDSQTNLRKARLYFYHAKGIYFIKCHNCGASKKFSSFLRDFDSILYREYCYDNFIDSKEVHVEDTQYKIKKPDVTLVGLKRVSSLSTDHIVRNYVDNRKIPLSCHYKLYYSPLFSKWCNEHAGTSLFVPKGIDPRLILPLINRKGEVFGIQGRDLTGKSPIRYITTLFNNNNPKVS